MSVLDAFKNKKKGEETSTTDVKTSTPSKSVNVSTHVVKSVIERPHASEKAYSLHAQRQYVFMVNPSANKIQVKEEVQRRYHVTVTDMNMSVHKGKKKFYRGRQGKASISKKAFVTLKEGDKIEIV
jgi:large subunit ribosomal protein L23